MFIMISGTRSKIDDEVSFQQVDSNDDVINIKVGTVANDSDPGSAESENDCSGEESYLGTEASPKPIANIEKRRQPKNVVTELIARQNKRHSEAMVASQPIHADEERQPEHGDAPVPPVEKRKPKRNAADVKKGGTAKRFCGVKVPLLALLLPRLRLYNQLLHSLVNRLPIQLL